MTGPRTGLALAALGALLLLGAGGDTYRWQRPVDATPGWNVLELPDDVLAASRAGLQDLRVAAGDDELPYAFAARVGPSAQAIELRDVESSPGRETSAIADRGAHAAAAGAIQIAVDGASPFLKPVLVEASDDRTTWRQIAKGSIFRTQGAEMSTLRFAPNDRRYWRLRLDDRNSEPVRPVSITVPRPAETSRARRAAVVFARAPSDSEGVSVYTIELPSRHFPLVGLVLDARDAAFERRVQVYERVVFRDEVSRRLVGESTVFRSADGREAASLVPLADASSSVLELEVADGDSPPLDLSGVSAVVEPPRLVFFARPGVPLALRYGSETARSPRYDLDVALALGRPASLHDARLGAAADRGAPAPATPPVRGPKLPDAGAWTVRRPIALPARGTLAYLDLDPRELPGARLVDAEGRQVPYVLESAPHHVRRSVEIATSERARTTELRVRGLSPGEAADTLQLRATAPDYFERSVVVSEEVRDERGPVAPRWLGAATWKRSPGGPFVPLRVSLGAPQGPVLVAIDNGDNAPLTLSAAAVEIRVERIEFVFDPSEQLTLLTANAASGAPRYDLALLASVILASPAEVATLGAAAPQPAQPPAVPRWFWLAVAGGGALVVLVLLRTLGAAGGEGAKS